MSWPGLTRPSTSLPVSAPPVVDGRHKAGHDAGVTGAAILTPTPACPGHDGRMTISSGRTLRRLALLWWPQVDAVFGINVPDGAVRDQLVERAVDRDTQ